MLFFGSYTCYNYFFNKSQLKKYFLPISRESSYEAIFRCVRKLIPWISKYICISEEKCNEIACFSFLFNCCNKFQLFNHSSKPYQILQFILLCHFLQRVFTNTNNGLPVRLHPSISHKYLANLVEMGQCYQKISGTWGFRNVTFLLSTNSEPFIL